LPLRPTFSLIRLLPAAYCGPYFLKQILQSLTSPPDGEPTSPNLRKNAYIYAFLTLGAQLARAEVDLLQLWHGRRAIIRCRTQLMGEVYQKALRRKDLSGLVAKEQAGVKASEPAKGKKGGKAPAEGSKTSTSNSTGKIVRLMSSDCNK
jgi:hypothetical protein